MEVNLKLEQDEMEGVDDREWVSTVAEIKGKRVTFYQVNREQASI